MGEVSPSIPVDKSEPEDGRAMSLQQLLDLWLSFPPRVRRSVLRGLWNHEQHLGRVAANNAKASQREHAAGLIAPTQAARWLLRGISKAMDPTYDLRADGSPNAETYRTHHAPEVPR